MIECVIDTQTGAASLEQSRALKTGTIELRPLSGVRQIDLGKSKDVFKLTINGMPGVWVAKVFFDIGQGRGNALETNELLLLHDLVRLKRLNIFRDQFMHSARETSAEVSNFVIADAFVIIVQSHAGKEVNVAYLVEPLRSSTMVEKFSGTIGGSDNTPNKLFSTMSAFTHYILEKTACRLAFTDLQGSLHCPKAGAVQELVLFDPMTHSLSGNTGVGDHGPEGIEDTIRNHKCSFMCNSMRLANIPSLKATFTAEKDKLNDMDTGSDSESEDGVGKPVDALDGFVLTRAAAVHAQAGPNTLAPDQSGASGNSTSVTSVVSVERSVESN
ncbi:kinase-like domain-containing protein [Mycena galericulata]|nr:kinase-like domain-containing protein [Mycena galericulata]